MNRTPCALLVLAAILQAGGALAASPITRAAPRPHELGWVCLTVSDTRVLQVQSFNKDAPDLTVWVTRDRFHVEVEGNGPQGRLCIPAVVRVGDDAPPENTLVFERELRVGETTRPAVAELVVVPESAQLAEATVKLVGVSDQWRQRDGVWTFNAGRVAAFPPRVARGLPGGLGPDPGDVFNAAAAMDGFTEPCQPHRLTGDTVGSFGVYSRSTQRVSARGVEPFRLRAGAVVSRCDGVASDGTMIAVAQRLEGGELAWFVVPRESPMEPLEDELRFSTDKPLGGYHVCRTPTWTTSLLEEVALAAKWELLPSGEWRWLTGERRDRAVLPAGGEVTLLDHREGWALVRVVVDGAGRTLALPAETVAIPTGPAPEVRSLDGGLCHWPKGEWRAVSANTQAFRVAQDAPGAELAGLWIEIPQGTRVLSLCQHRDGCDPIYVGGAQVGETERVVLVRFAGQLLGVRQRDLRDRISGTFDTRRERNAYWPADDSALRRDEPVWALGIGPGARISFVRQDDMAWAARVRLQHLDEDLGFEGAIGVGGDGHGTLLELTGGAGTLFHRFEDSPVELRGAILGKIDLRFADGGGLGVDVIAKGQLRWVNDFAPLSLEIGINIGYGGTFGATGASGVTFGMPVWLNLELVQF